MNKGNLKKKQRNFCCFLMLLFVSGGVFAEGSSDAQKHNPFSGSGGNGDNGVYGSILTSSEFDNKTPQQAPKTLVTPVQPIASGPLNSGTPAAASARVLVLHENMLLSQGLNEWAKDSGYKMLWNSAKDYIIYSTISFTGKTQDEVLGELGKLFASENYGLVIKFYQKNNVLLVDEQ